MREEMAEIIVKLTKEELIALTDKLKEAPAVPVQESQRIEDDKEFIKRIKREVIKTMNNDNGLADSRHTLIGL
jgi:hypothetical protein